MARYNRVTICRDSANFDNSYKIDNCSNTFFIDIKRTCIPHYKPILL